MVFEVNCQACANKQTDTTEDCRGIEFNGQFLEILGKFFYLGDTIGARGGAVDSVITRICSGWNNFSAFVSR